MNPFNDIETWETLLGLSEGRQLNQIAHESKISLAALIRRIRTIENTWGVKLLSTNKPIRLTSAAVNFLPEIRTLCESHRKLQHRFETAKDYHSSLSGQIRFAVAAGSLGSQNTHRLLMEFSTQHKGIEFQTEIGPNLNKVLNGTCDVSTFTGNLDLSGLEAIPRGRAKYFALASPSYIKKFGYPHHPSELSQHFCAVFCGASRARTEYLLKAKEKRIVTYGKTVTSTDVLFLKHIVLQGEALIVDLPIGHCAKEIKLGHLVPILDGWHRNSEPLWIVTSGNKWKDPKIRIFMKWYATAWSEMLQKAEDSLRNCLNDVFIEEILDSTP